MDNEELEGVKFSEFPSATPDNADEVVGLHAGDNARFSVANFVLAVRQGLANLFVPLTRTVNGKALSADITLDASDVGAVNAADVGAADGVAGLDSNGKVPGTQLDLSDKQDKITASGILKGDGQGGVSAATPGTDYQAPLTIDATPTANSTNPVQSGGVYADVRTRVPVYGMGENLLDNAYFVGGGSQLGDGIFPINRRGQTSYVGGGYGIDRWQNANNTTVTIYSDGIKNDGGGFRQYIEKSRIIDGRVYTLSLLTELGFVSATGTLSASGSGWQISTLTGTGWAGVQYVSGKYDIRITGSQKNKAIKLELGTEQTLCHQENGVWVLNEISDYWKELRKCQVYQIVFHAAANKNIGLVYRYSASDADICIPLPVSMRAAPTVETSSTFRVIRDGGATNIAASTLNGVICNLSENMATIHVNVDVGGNGRLDGSGAATLILNANLV